MKLNSLLFSSLVAVALPSSLAYGLSASGGLAEARPSFAAQEDPRAQLAAIFTVSASSDWIEHIVSLGAAPVPVWIEVLFEKNYGAEDAPRPLSRSQEQALLEAIGELPATPTRTALGARLARGPFTAENRDSAYRILTKMGRAQDALLLTQVTTSGQGRSVPRPERIRYRSILETLIERDPTRLSVLGPVFDAAHPSLLYPVVEVMGRHESTEALGLLGELLGRSPEVDPLILGELAKLGQALPHPLDPRVQSNVRRSLRREDVRLLLAAIDAAAKLEDFDAIPDLIGLLDHPYDSVRTKAREGLKLITGRRFALDSDIWEEWYTDEMDWWSQRAPRELQLIETGQPAQVSEGLMELSRRRIFRHQLVPSFATALEREEKDLQILACASLGFLDSHVAVPDLIRVLSQENDDVRMAAWKALRKITDHDLPAEYSAWRPVLELYRGNTR